MDAGSLVRQRCVCGSFQELIALLGLGLAAARSLFTPCTLEAGLECKQIVVERVVKFPRVRVTEHKGN